VTGGISVAPAGIVIGTLIRASSGPTSNVAVAIPFGTVKTAFRKAGTVSSGKSRGLRARTDAPLASTTGI